MDAQPNKLLCIKGGNKEAPITPFLFLLVAEGLSGLCSWTIGLDLFSEFRIGASDISVSNLQYAYDTIILKDALVDNLWSIKAILQGFELTSDLRVNFAKSSHIEVNVDPDFLVLASDFLHCNLVSLLFRLLGLSTGANPRSDST